jgi:hypothetical protein
MKLGELATLRGEFEGAGELLEGALREACSLGDSSLEVAARAALARIELERRNYAGVMEITEEVRVALPEAGLWREDFLTTAMRALAHLDLGEEPQAWEETARLEQLYQGKDGWFEGRPEGDVVRMRIIHLDGDAELAAMIGKQGIREAAGRDPYGEGLLQLQCARVTASIDPAAAWSAAERAVEVFEALGAQPMLGRAKGFLARLSGSARDRERSSEPIRGRSVGGAEGELDRLGS